MTRIGIATILATTLVACAGPGDTSTPTDTPPADVYSWLVSEEVPFAAPIAVDTSTMPKEDLTDPREAVGVAPAIDAAVELASLSPADLTGAPRAIAGGAIRAEGDGFVWSAAVSAPGATALRLELAEMYLPGNASLYLYDDRGEVDGPYTGRGPAGDGQVWARTMMTDQVMLQLRYQGSDTARVLDAVRFVIRSAGVMDDRFAIARYNFGEDLERSFCSFNAACVENASCSSIPSAIQPARDAIAQLLFKSGGWYYICSGGLIADTDTTTDIPYLLTANHCISRSGEASSLETYFMFSTSCGGSCNSPSTASTTGSTIVAGAKTGDFTLLLLSQAAPDGTVALPFSTTPVANSNGTSLFRISHPGGAPQAYSEHRVDTSAGTCSSWPRGSWIYSHDTYGATEGGSSGSPVLNASGQIVGQLSGACGTNVNDNCDSTNNATVDGALASYYDKVSAWLDPGTGSCTDADGDGYCVSDGDCNDANAAIHPGATELCNGVDDNCDGVVDEGCGGGTCDLLPVGASCGSNSECCSNHCRGRKGNKTCR